MNAATEQQQPANGRLQLQAYANSVVTVEEAMNYAISAAAEAYGEVKADKGNDEDAHVAAGEAYRNALPMLRGRGNVQAYIATVAEGVAMEFISTSEARVMLYAAKLAIAAQAEVR